MRCSWASHTIELVRLGRLGVLVALSLAVLIALAPAGPAEAATYNINWAAPTGTYGWCTVNGNLHYECFATPVEACRQQMQYYNPTKNFQGYVDTDRWATKSCSWGPWGGVASTIISYLCSDDFARSPPGVCRRENEVFQSCDPCALSHGGTPNPVTPRPIEILTGAKVLAATDFELANSALGLTRRFHSLRSGGEGGSMIMLPPAFANWSHDYALELHLGGSWSQGIAGLNTPVGGHYRFVRSGANMLPYQDATYPLLRTDYAVQFVGTFPASTTAVRNAKSQWIVRDAENRTWFLETFRSPGSGLWDVARPVRRVDNSGAELAFAYDAFGALHSVTDSYGRRITFSWIEVNEIRRAISAVHLPDGTRLDFTYDVETSVAMPYRLTRVERRDQATNALLDKTSYQYGDAGFPTFVTGVLDRDDAVRWTITYDGEGRATSSAAPGGGLGYTIAYSAPGTTFTRTVTNPLGKQTVYTVTRANTVRYEVKLASVSSLASPNTPATSAARTYDAARFLATAADDEGRVTSTTRDGLGRATQQIEAQGTGVARTTTYTWHSDIHAPTVVTEPGLTTTSTFTGVSSAGPFVPTYAVTQAFPFSGAAQTYAVPGGLTSLTAELWGGAGGNGNGSVGAWSGAGAYLKATFAVTPGDTITVETAGGGQGAAPNTAGGAGGWPDGGSGGFGNRGSGGGGGSSRLYINGVLKAVAAGGGGSGGYLSGTTIGGEAGAGGANGQSATRDGGLGANQSAGGVDGSDPTNANKTGRSIIAFPGAQRTGGWGASTGDNTTSTTDDGGGGGGGYWGGGGGGGDGQPGGGGSSWVAADATDVDNLGGNRQSPARTPDSLPAVATGVNSAANGPAVPGGDGHVVLRLK